jgi:hypothetical protein
MADLLGLRITGAIDNKAAGGWPFAHILTVSSTDPDADYTTLPLANAAAAAGDVILLDAETYSLTAMETLADIGLTIEGRGPGTVITSNITNSTAFFINAANITFRNCTIRHTGAGTASGVFQVNANNFTLDNCIVEKTSGAPTTGYGVWAYAGTGHRFINGTKITCTSGTTKYGMQNSLAAITLAVEGGEITGDTKDIYTGHASTVVELRGVKLLGGGIEINAGAVQGWYYGTSGQFIAVGLSQLLWTPPSFSVNKNSTDQTGIVTVTFTKVTWSAEAYDTHGWFASDKYTPLLAGKYFFDIKLYYNAAIDQSLVYAFVYKNGANVAELPTQTSGTGAIQIRGNIIMEANGSSDYFEIYTYHFAGSDQTISGNPAVTSWTGFFLGR